MKDGGAAGLANEYTSYPATSTIRPSCQLVIADHKASRQHCTIERRQDKFMLRDHSTNGTFVTVDGELEVVLQREEFQLRKRGWIALGQSRGDTREVVEFFCE